MIVIGHQEGVRGGESQGESRRSLEVGGLFCKLSSPQNRGALRKHKPR